MTPDNLNKIVESVADRNWRMNNLYRIKNKDGQIVPFVMNESQSQFWFSMWWLNVILKDRQRGFSTLIAIFILDSCMFTSNTQAGIIDITLPDAKKKLDKIRFGYHSLPDALKAKNKLVVDAKESLEWENGSRVDVSTSHRGGTLQILHVSEFGKIAARKPDVAREIKTGAFNTVAPENFIFVESTAEGKEGLFYDMCKSAMDLQLQKQKLTSLDFKFHFFGWWMGNENELPENIVEINTEQQKYFEKIESDLDVSLSGRKRAWYVKKSTQQGDDMKREYPSTPDEAFEQAVDGAYYSRAMTRMRSEGRISIVPYDEGFPVDTFWDLGINDSMSIWFRQRIGTQNRIIDYEEGSGEGLSHYARLLDKKPYRYRNHYMPHDIRVRELGSDGVSRKRKAEELGIKPIEVVERARDTEAVLAGIEEVRTFLSTCWIDADKCSKGIKCLDGYRKAWDEKLGAFKRAPLHNWASNGADAMRTGAIAVQVETAHFPINEIHLEQAEKDWNRVVGVNNNVCFNLED